MPAHEITALEAVRTGTKATVIHIDGRPWRRTSRAVVAKLGLAEGDMRDLAQLESAVAAAEPAAARERALAALSRAETSAHRLCQRLLADGYPPEVADSVVASLADIGWVDDERYARILAASLAEVRGYGRVRVARELASRGIDARVAEAVLDDVCPEAGERDRAQRAAERLAAAARGSAERLGRRLVGRGFTPGDAYESARRVLATDFDHVRDEDPVGSSAEPRPGVLPDLDGE